jgi:phenylacetaldehyde dehydrogenase
MASSVPAAQLPELLPSVQAFLRRSPTMLIGGKWVPAASGRTFATRNPADGSELAQVPYAEAEDVDRAVEAARRAFDGGPWSRTSPSGRAKLMWKLADLIDGNADELAQLETLDNGKPFSVARRGDIPGAAEMFRYMAGWATKIEGTTIPYGVPDAIHAYTRREPVGVAGQIIPWNFPLSMASWKLAPALATGCVAILKPAEQTPLTALRLGELVIEAGFPDGVVNVLSGYGETAGAAIAAHPGVDKVAFTGSTEVGKLIVQAATGNLKKVSLELGGKSPSIVLPDADLDVAVKGAANNIFFNAGQVCTAGSRLFVQSGVFDDVLAGVAAHAGKLRVGPGLASDTQMGPLVSEEQLERVTGYMAEGVREGARAAAGGSRMGDVGYFVEPTIFTDVRNDMKIVREEIFGPVVTAIPFKDLDDLVAHANDSIYGLAAAIWTRDVSKAHTLAAKVKAGTVFVNGTGGDASLPFGGFKQSGWGREKGREGLDLYTEVKTVVVNL